MGTFGSSVKIYTLSLTSTKHRMFCIVMKNAVGSVQISNIKVSSTVKDKPNHNIHGKLVVHVPVVENGVLLNIAERLTQNEISLQNSQM